MRPTFLRGELGTNLGVGSFFKRKLVEVERHFNGAYCLNCHTILVSTHVHDFRGCECEEERRVCVDGGYDYRRRVYGKDARWTELSHYPTPAECEELQKASEV